MIAIGSVAGISTDIAWHSIMVSWLVAASWEYGEMGEESSSNKIIGNDNLVGI